MLLCDSLVMAIVVGCMGFAQNVHELIGLRLFQGVITGTSLLIAFITTSLFVKESFTRQNKKVLHVKEIWSMIPNKSLTLLMSVTFFVITLALYSVEPIITVYVTQISHNGSHVALLASLTFSASGLASILAAPRLGELSDKIGA